MSRPTRPHPTLNRKDWIENHLVNRRNREDATRSTWKSAAKYFQDWDVEAKKYADLTSPESYQTSMNAYVERKRQEDQEKLLNVRRIKLANLYHEENEKYQAELKALLNRQYRKIPTLARSHPGTPSLALPETLSPFMPQSPFYEVAHSPDKMIPVDDAEEVPAPMVEPAVAAAAAAAKPGPSSASRAATPLCGCHKSATTPREVATPPGHNESANRAGSPAALKHGGLSTARTSVVEAPPGGQCESMSRRPIEDLVVSMKFTEREAEALKQECTALQHALDELQRLAQQRFLLDKPQPHMEPTNRGNKLKQPYKVKIQAQSHSVQNLMEFDLKFIETMLTILRLIDDRDSSIYDDLGQIHVSLMQNLKVERYELLQSECLFHEEAERTWHRKVEEWEIERVSRAALIEKTWRFVETKVQAQMAANLERQQANITSRENVLRDIDAGNYESLQRATPLPRRSSECPAIERLQL